jgi:hypothetical protein
MSISRKQMTGVILALAYLVLAFMLFRRGETWLAVCLIGVCLLQFVRLTAKRAGPPKPSIRLNIDGPADEPEPDPKKYP